ncbi:MAG: hypothetical protein ACQEXG_15480 [Pseudomonadota bacterium]
MSITLYSLKPLEIDEWLLDVESQQRFYDELNDFLCVEVARQFIGVERHQVAAFIKGKLSSADSGCEDTYDEGQELSTESGWDATPPDLDDLDISLARGEKSLILREIRFPAADERLGFDYTKLLKLFPSLHFVNCHFYCHSLSFGASSTKCRFEVCTFHLAWQVEEGSGPGKGHVLFTECCFQQGVTIEGNEIEQSPVVETMAFFKDCVIRDALTLRKMVTDIPVFANSIDHKPVIDKILVEGCEFESRFTLANEEGISKVVLTNTVFKNKFAFIHCPIAKLAIKNVNFEGLADFYESSFESFLIRKSIFRDFAGFEDCRFGAHGEQKGRIQLRYVTFYSFINFRSAHFLLPVDLRNTNRSEPPNFLDCTFSVDARKGTDRETFRIIKHSFEAVGNRIEANHFYALEMEAYRRELCAGTNQYGRHWRLWERLLVSLNFGLSRHGQSYWQPMLGVLVCAALIAVQQANWQAGWVAWPDSALWLIEPLAATLNAWASGVIIFRPLYTAFPGQEAFILLMAVLLSTCTWHFLMAARRHQRR